MSNLTLCASMAFGDMRFFRARRRKRQRAIGMTRRIAPPCSMPAMMNCVLVWAFTSPETEPRTRVEVRRPLLNGHSDAAVKCLGRCRQALEGGAVLPAVSLGTTMLATTLTLAVT